MILDRSRGAVKGLSRNLSIGPLLMEKPRKNAKILTSAFLSDKHRRIEIPAVLAPLTPETPAGAYPERSREHRQSA